MISEEVFLNSDLQDLPKPLLKELLGLAEVVDLEEGKVVWQRGEALDDKLYLVLEGEIKVIFKNTSGIDQPKRKLPGQVCGEAAFFTVKKTRLAYVYAFTAVKALCWSNVQALLDDPHFEPFRHRLSVLSNGPGSESEE